ncbi:hypothetical protein B0T16DRAFT_417675 [Cercophora newfieldiana]|uniref:Nephrocystin 3-like N-terminal domain-containing protein n=1 Tax=Cercophora newfieldiana TaxID=92897 RepID=A0AA39Y2A5_9PEZI|nr:hypothetical protein B0T16DRAFT_417675 [Cercophora newfieldiana]
MMSPELNALQRWLSPSTGPQKRELDARFKAQQETVDSYETCQWLLNLDIYREWADPRTTANILWIHGKPGSGKSVLAAFIVKLLRRQTGPNRETDVTINCSAPTSSPTCPVYRKPTSVMFFFCGLESAKEFASNIVGTFVHQLLLSHSQNTLLQSALLHLASLAPNREGPDVKSLSDFLKEYCSLLGPFYIIVDALEENAHVSECLEALHAFQGCSSVRILILSQQTSNISREMPQRFPGHAAFGIEEYTKNDIDQYIQRKTASLLKNQPALAEMEQDIIQHMQSQADGMFQWVNACIGHLQDEVSDATEGEEGSQRQPAKQVSRAKVRETLSALHPGLNSTYRKVFERILRTTSDFEHSRIRSALCWLCVPGGDLRASDVWRAVEMEEDASPPAVLVDSDGSYFDKSSARRLSRLLGSLLELQPGEDGEVFARVCHPSLKIFLTQPNPDASNSAPTRFQLTNEDAHVLCAKVCMRVCADSCQRLYRSDSAARRNPLVAYSWTYWAFHLKLSERAFESANIEAIFDNMMLRVSENSLRFAIVLSQYATAPRVLPDIKDRLESVIAMQRAQAALIKLLRSLDNIRVALPVSQTLSRARQLAKDSERQYAGSAIWSASQVSKTYVSAYQRHKSAVSRLAVDSLLQLHPWSDIELPEAVHNLGDVARGLRLVALQFAVSPVYEDFMRQFDDSPSIFVFLTFTASFFESVASFPLWKKLPDFIHPERAFVVMDPKDEGYGGAAFVRRRLQERERYRLLMPSVSVRNWNEIHSVSVKPHHGIPAHRWYTSMVAYRLFSGPPGLGQTFIINPLHNAHQRFYSHLDINGAQYLQAPSVAMSRYVPQAIQDAPVQTFLASIPSLLSLYVAKYAEMVSIALFGRWGWVYLQISHWRFTGALNRLSTVPTIFRFLAKSGQGYQFLHIGVGLFLYGLRWKFCPWLGAHLFPHPIRDLVLAFSDPLEFFKEYYSWTWTQSLFATIQAGVGMTMMQLAFTMFGHQRPVSDFARIFVTFWYLTFLERSVCAGVNAVTPTIAVLSAVFSDHETLRSLMEGSFIYWTRVFIGLCQMGFNMLVIAQMGSGMAIIAILLTNILVVFFLVWYSDAITNFFTAIVWGVTWPVRAVAHAIYMLGVKPLLEASEVAAELAVWSVDALLLPFLKICGILTVLLVLLYGARIFGRFCADPLDLQDTATELVEETRRARRTLPGVGDAPLRLEGVGAQTAPAKPAIRLPFLRHMKRGKVGKNE